MSRDDPALSVWVRLARAYHAVLRAARGALGDQLTLPQFDVLAQLARAADEGRPCTVTDLSRMMLVTAGNVSGLVDRLAARGLVRREPDPADRRCRLLQLTPAGRALWHRARDRHAASLADTLSDLPPAALTRLRRDLGALRAVAEAASPANGGVA